MSKYSEELITDFEQKVRESQRAHCNRDYNTEENRKEVAEELEWSRQRLVKYMIKLEASSIIE